MTGELILWGHALTALLFALIAIGEARVARPGFPQRSFVVAAALTAIWALTAAGIDPRDLSARVAETLRNAAWLGFMYALVVRQRDAVPGRAIAAIYGVVMALLGITLGVAVAEAASAGTVFAVPLGTARVLLRMLAAVTALLLVNHLHGTAASGRRGGVALLAAALALFWGVDLLLYTIAYLVKVPSLALAAVRGMVLILVAPLFALAVHRGGNWSLKLSRTVAYQSLSVAAIGAYLLVAGLLTSAIAAVGGPYARVAETALVFGTSASVFALVGSPAARAWAKVKLAKHLFRHRYDYRQQWQRFTDTLARPEGDAAPLGERIAKAVADLTDSPAALLLVAEEGGLAPGAVWRWDGPSGEADGALAAHLAATARIVELDGVRAGSDAEDAPFVPQWMLDGTLAWALVPLVHGDRLAGAILLARPPLDRALDWEDLDLLRLAGRGAASYLAEARAQEALAEAGRFEEFNRRFAFILHDIKNLVSQLSLVARNAERHAENPAFRADMVATLNECAGRMTELLARLSPAGMARPGGVEAVALMPLVERVAARRRGAHPIACIGARDAVALADPAALETLLGHLLQNAIDASDPAAPITLAVAASAIEVIDHGRGMSPAFIRTALFKPFVSTKPGGFGIGAFEARALAAAMDGSLSVTSREGEGTRFCVTLRPATPLERAA